MSEVYRIGIAILMSDGASPVLSKLSGKLIGIHKTTKDIEAGFKRWGLAIGGAAAIAGGSAMLGGLAKIANAGKGLLDQQNQMLRLGMAQSEIARLTAGYFQNVAKAVPTSTVEDYLSTVKELRAVLGTSAEAERFAPQALQFDALLSNVMGKPVHGELYKLLRAGELKGIATDPEKLNDLVQQSYSYIAAFGGKLTAGMIQNMATRGGTAWMNANLKEAFGPMAVLAAEMGGGGGSSSSPGVVLYQLQQLMEGANTMSKQQMGVFQKLHLIDVSKAHKTGFGGGRYQLDPGAIVGSLQYAGNVPGWAKNVVWPALVKASTIDGKLNEGLLQNYLSKIAPTTNKAKAVELFGNPEFLKQQMKDLGLAGKTLKLGPSYASFSSANPKGVEEAFGNQWHSMVAAIGAPMMQAALPIMRSITDVFTRVGALANAHPEAVKIIGEGIAALGVALVATGVTAIIAAIGPAGWIAGGIAALGAALAAVPWKSVWTSLGNVIMWVADKVVAAVNAIKSVIPGLGAAPGGGAGVKTNPYTGMPQMPHGPLGPAPSFGKQGYNAVPPTNGGSKFAAAGDIYMDGKKVGAIVSRHQALAANGPLRGSAYMDGTAVFTPADFAYARG